MFLIQTNASSTVSQNVASVTAICIHDPKKLGKSWTLRSPVQYPGISLPKVFSKTSSNGIVPPEKLLTFCIAFNHFMLSHSLSLSTREITRQFARRSSLVHRRKTNTAKPTLEKSSFGSLTNATVVYNITSEMIKTGGDIMAMWKIHATVAVPLQIGNERRIFQRRFCGRCGAVAGGWLASHAKRRIRSLDEISWQYLHPVCSNLYPK